MEGKVNLGVKKVENEDRPARSLLLQFLSPLSPPLSRNVATIFESRISFLGSVRARVCVFTVDSRCTLHFSRSRTNLNIIFYPVKHSMERTPVAAKAATTAT